MSDAVLSPFFNLRNSPKFYVIERVTSPCPRQTNIQLDLNCAYTMECVLSAIKRRPWCTLVVVDDATTATASDRLHIQIADFENISWEPVMSGDQATSSYLVRKGLSRKAQLALQIHRYLSKHTSSILKTAVPLTLTIETWNAFDDSMKVDLGRGMFANLDSHTSLRMPLRQRLDWCLEDVKDAVEHPDRASWHWILKPSVTNKGANIIVAKDWNDIVDALEDESDIREWVLQRYVDKPLLLEGYKFHLRVYVLCVGALEVFVFDRILMLLAGRKYNLSDLDDIHNHLTNTARAIELEDFNEELFVKVLDDLPSLLIQNHPSKAPDLATATHIRDNILEQVHEITAELFTAFENEYTIFAPMSNCFELFGLDFLVDDEFKVSLLEVNPGPDFKQTGDRLRSVIVQLWEQTISLIIDSEVFAKDSGFNQHQRQAAKPFVRAPDFSKVYSKEWSASQFKGGMGFS